MKKLVRKARRNQPSDILDTAKWVRYDPSMCRGCWAGCCTLPVPVDPEDLYHMGYLEADQVNGPLKRIAARLQKDGIVQSFDARARTFILQQKNGTDCVFLDERRRCTIYERRPHICRRFPESSLRPGFCPSRRK